jgi:hypothetical protein
MAITLAAGVGLTQNRDYGEALKLDLNGCVQVSGFLTYIEV